MTVLGIRGKLILMASSVCLIPCLLFMAFVFTQVNNNYTEKSKEDLVVSTELKMMWMESWCDNIVGLAESIATRDMFRNETDNQTIREYLEQVKANYIAESVALITPDGTTSINTDGLSLDLSHRSYVQEALAGSISPGGFVVSEAKGNTIFTVAAPILDNGTVLGAILITSNVQDGVDLFNKAYGLESRDSFFLNPDCMIMTEGRLNKNNRLTTIDTLPAIEMKNYPSGSEIYINHQGIRVAGSWHVSKYGWAIVEEVEVSEIQAPVNQMLLLMFAMMCVMIIAALGFAFYYSKSIALPIRQLATSATKLAEGDIALENRVNINRKDEIGQLVLSYNTALNNTREIIAKVKKVAEELGEKASGISTSSDEVAASNTEQSNIAQEVSQAITELSKATEEIASNAYEARQSGDKAFNEAQDSSKAVREAIESLNSIKDAVYELGVSSKRIGEIVSVIDDIADQTNLLALNAAIEAARAGEHGKSFTVVAEAVRSLAEKSSESTKQIASLVGDTQQQIQDSIDISETGAGRANLAMGALDTIVDQIEAIASKIGEISAAGEQQSASSQEVTASMESLSATSEEVSASSQEMAGSAKLLARLSQDLRGLVDQFINV